MDLLELDLDKDHLMRSQKVLRKFMEIPEGSQVVPEAQGAARMLQGGMQGAKAG